MDESMASIKAKKLDELIANLWLLDVILNYLENKYYNEFKKEGLICPITERVMRKPVRIKSRGNKYYFEKSALEKQFEQFNYINPYTNQRLSRTERHFTYSPRKTIATWQVIFRMSADNDDLMQLMRCVVITPSFSKLPQQKRMDHFIDALEIFIKHTTPSRAQIFMMFEEMKKPKGQFAFIHKPDYPTLSKFLLFFKSNRNIKEDYFWHTQTYQKAVKILKEAYLKQVNSYLTANIEKGDCFIDYVRGNSPVHWSETTTRKQLDEKKISFIG